MSVELHTAVEGWRFVGGGVVEDPAGLLVEEVGKISSATRGRGNLYVLLDLEGPSDGRDEVARQLVQTIRKTYHGQRGSVTGGLRQALLAANHTLLQMNHTLPYEKQRMASAVCLVLRGADAYAAHVGDVMTLVVGDGQFLCFQEGGGQGSPGRLGLRRDLEVALFHTDVGAGQTFLLASGELTRLKDPESLAAWVQAKGLLGALGAVTSPARADLLALGIELSGEDEAPETLDPRARLAPSAPLPAQPAAEAEEVAPGKSVGEIFRSLGKGLRNVLLAGLGVLMLLTRGLVTFLGRLMPPAGEKEEVEARAEERRARRREGRKVGPWAVVLALAVPLAVALLAGAIYWQRGREREEQYQQLLGDAQTLYQEAAQTADTAQARAMYLQALERTGQAEQIQPGTEEVRLLREGIHERVRQVDQVRPLYGLGALWTYQEPNSRPGRVVSNGHDVFVLDVGTSQVHRHVLSETREVLSEDAEDEVILQRGDVVGGVVVRDILDIVWMPAGGKRTQSSLLALDSGGQVISWQPNWGAQVVEVYGTQTWQAPSLLSSFTQGRLYILDKPQRQILRYTPFETGYTGSPEKYFVAEGGEDLQGVVDIAINGYVYLLYGDGRIAKYEMGQPISYVAQPPPDGWKGPVALFTGPDTGTTSVVRYLYVADAGGQRIVRLSKEGEFLGQYVAPDDDANALADLNGFFVDEDQGLMFLVSGRTLYRSPFRLEE